MVTITGNTYPVKDAIKALGGRWNANKKGWDVPESNAKKAQSLVNGAPKTTFSAISRPAGVARYPYGGNGRACGYPGCTGGRTHCDECSE